MDARLELWAAVHAATAEDMRLIAAPERCGTTRCRPRGRERPTSDGAAGRALHLRAGSARPAAANQSCGAGAVTAGRRRARITRRCSTRRPHAAAAARIRIRTAAWCPAPGSRISAAPRRAMPCTRSSAQARTEPLTDSMQMFKWGVEGGKPAGSEPGMQPEWFYKGNGGNVVGCGRRIASPRLRAGQRRRAGARRPVRHRRRTARRSGWASPSATSSPTTSPSARNYLCWRIRSCASAASGRSCVPARCPRTWKARSRIRRGGAVLWEKPFLTGEANMCHSFANLEYHHFKYQRTACPGDVHLHFFGTATLSFADGIRVQPGDDFEIDLPALGAPLVQSAGDRATAVSRCTASRTLIRSLLRSEATMKRITSKHAEPPLPAAGSRACSRRWPPARDTRRRAAIVLGFSQIGAESEWRTANTESIKRPRPDAGIDAEVLRRAAEAGKPDQGDPLLHRAEGRRDRVLAGGGNRLGHGAAARPRPRSIPVILTDRAVDVQRRHRCTVGFIGSDFVEEGRKAGRWLVENTKDAQRRRQHRRAAGHRRLGARQRPQEGLRGDHRRGSALQDHPLADRRLHARQGQGSDGGLPEGRGQEDQRAVRAQRRHGHRRHPGDRGSRPEAGQGHPHHLDRRA